MKAKPAELVLSLAILSLGIAVAIGTAGLSGAGGYARIGPNVAPAVIAGGLIVLGLWLLYEAVFGGWRNAVPDSPDARGEHDFSPSAFIWVSIGLIAQMLLIHRAGDSVHLRCPRLRQQAIPARFRHRPGTWPCSLSFLREIPKREPAAGLVGSDYARRGDLASDG